MIGRRRHLSLGVGAWERTPKGLWESGQCRQFERVCLCCVLAMRAGTTTTTEFMKMETNEHSWNQRSVVHVHAHQYR